MNLLTLPVGLLACAAGLSLLVIPLAVNGNVPTWQKVIHWTSAISLIGWGLSYVFAPSWAEWLRLWSTAINSLGCLDWTRRYYRMMRRNRINGGNNA